MWLIVSPSDKILYEANTELEVEEWRNNNICGHDRLWFTGHWIVTKEEYESEQEY